MWPRCATSSRSSCTTGCFSASSCRRRPGSPGRQLQADLRARAAQLRVAVEFTPLDDHVEPPPATRHHVTVLGAPLSPAAFAGVTRRLARCEANIERILRLSEFPLSAYDLLVSGGTRPGCAPSWPLRP